MKFNVLHHATTVRLELVVAGGNFGAKLQFCQNIIIIFFYFGIMLRYLQTDSIASTIEQFRVIVIVGIVIVIKTVFYLISTTISVL
jgi:uncharacterized membrane protein